MNIINEKIVTVLKEKKIKQKDLCESINIPASTLNTWLKQGRSIPSEFLIPICEFLDISINWLLTGEGEMCKPATDIQLNISTAKELSLDKKLILLKYDELSDTEKLKFLELITSTSGTSKVPKGKLSIYKNGEIGTTKEKIIIATQKIAC